MLSLNCPTINQPNTARSLIPLLFYYATLDLRHFLWNEELPTLLFRQIITHNSRLFLVYRIIMPYLLMLTLLKNNFLLDMHKKVLKHYLVQDHRFLDVFVVLLATAVAKARTLKDRIPGCQFLALITSKENTYFERSFAALNVSEEDRIAIPNEECTDDFIELMRDVAERGYLGEILSVLVVCEWSYFIWGERVLPKTSRLDFTCYEWVDLHSGKSFGEVIEYLRGMLDEEGKIMSKHQREKCHQTFLRTVQLEKSFFDSCYKK